MVRPQFNRLSRVSQGRAVRRGFTLLEVMLVMGIIIMLAGLAAYGLMGAGDSANEGIAQIKAANYADACKRYKIQIGQYPNTLEDLVTPPQGISQNKWRRPFLDDGKLDPDPWGNPFRMEVNLQANQVKVTSAGMDGKFDTADDVSNID